VLKSSNLLGHSMLATPDDEWHHGKKSAQREQYQQNQAYLEAESTADHEEHIVENTHQKLSEDAAEEDGSSSEGATEEDGASEGEGASKDDLIARRVRV